MSKVVVSYGMGADSAAILARWHREPDLMVCSWEDVVVLTAMVGDEYSDTARLNEAYMLPLLREHGVRFVQVARKGPRTKDGYVVLDDSRHPEKLHIDGHYKISADMLAAGTIPTSGGTRKCSIHFKGVPLDGWLKDEFKGEPFTHVIGFNADEMSRVERDKSYTNDPSIARTPYYPLVEWGWGRERLERYLEESFGEPWAKSCCTFCPFSVNRKQLPDHLRRWEEEPDAAGQAVFIEHVAMALNPRMSLYSSRTAHGLVEEAGNAAAKSAFETMRDMEHAVYRVRRAFTKTKSGRLQAVRSVRVEASGLEPAEASEALRELAEARGLVLEADGAHERAWGARKVAGEACREELLVAAPAVVREKENPAFAKRWEALGKDEEPAEVPEAGQLKLL
jgi:hypothetical protein